ncbi:glycerophosphodiester phosphodiesterase [Chryseomicrobium palamuruense]|uniref:Glycerophosphodiester phosphodiesterase n=1 Tax=Chryseomicrobium palamuruense TaxID=682973 RepID=A0ABV8USZ3_9BACL
MKIFAHRGCSGDYPENTLAAFRAARELPIEGIELDVHLSRDGELMVIHDESVDRTTDGSGFVKDMMSEELRMLDAGIWKGEAFANERIPFLSEVLELFKDTTHVVNIELKSDIFPYEGMADRVLRLVDTFQMRDRVILSSFDHETIAYVAKIYPDVETAALTMEVLMDVPAYLKRLGVSSAHVFFPTAFRRMGHELKAANYPVRAYTVNEVAYADMLRKVGIDAIFTDYPERFL